MDREYGRLSIYLVHKYYREGETIRQIARTLSRSASQVKEILRQTLTEEEQERLKRYNRKGKLFRQGILMLLRSALRQRKERRDTDGR